MRLLYSNIVSRAVFLSTLHQTPRAAEAAAKVANEAASAAKEAAEVLSPLGSYFWLLAAVLLCCGWAVGLCWLLLGCWAVLAAAAAAAVVMLLLYDYQLSQDAADLVRQSVSRSTDQTGSNGGSVPNESTESRGGGRWKVSMPKLPKLPSVDTMTNDISDAVSGAVCLTQ